MGRLHSEGFDRGPIWAERVDVDTSTFSGTLSALDDNVQHALETIDQFSFAAEVHTHDDRYYTEGEVDTLLSGYAVIDHNHDSSYLKLDQTTSQTITASPVFDWGVSGRIPYYHTDKTLTSSASIRTDGSAYIRDFGSTGGDVGVYLCRTYGTFMGNPWERFSGLYMNYSGVSISDALKLQTDGNLYLIGHGGLQITIASGYGGGSQITNTGWWKSADFGADGIYDIGFYNTQGSLSIDPNARILYASDGTTPMLNWDTGGTVSIYDNALSTTGAMSAAYESWFGDAALDRVIFTEHDFGGGVGHYPMIGWHSDGQAIGDYVGGFRDYLVVIGTHGYATIAYAASDASTSATTAYTPTSGVLATSLIGGTGPKFTIAGGPLEIHGAGTGGTTIEPFKLRYSNFGEGDANDAIKMIFEHRSTAGGFGTAIDGNYITSTLLDPTDGSEDTQLSFGGYTAGVLADWLTLTGASLSMLPDTDTTHSLGRVKIGSAYADFAYFSHYDNMTLTNYALAQGTAGATFINSASGQATAFQFNGATTATLTATSLNVNGDTDTAHYFGRVKLTGSGDYAYIGHYDTNATTSYALAQGAMGTYINAVTGQNITFQKNAATVGYISDTIFNFGLPVYIDSNSNTGCLRLFGADAANEIADVYVLATGGLRWDLSVSGDTHANFQVKPGGSGDGLNYGFTLYENNGVTTFLNATVINSATNYVNFTCDASSATLGLTIDANQYVGIRTVPYTPLTVKQATGDFMGGLHLRAPVNHDTWSIVQGGDYKLYFGWASHASGADAAGDFTPWMTIASTGLVSLYSDLLIDSTLTLTSGSITDSTGAISFGDEDLTIGGQLNTSNVVAIEQQVLQSFWAFKYGDALGAGANTGLYFNAVGGTMDVRVGGTNVWSIVSIITGSMTYGNALDVIMTFAPNGTNTGEYRWMEDDAEDYFRYADDILMSTTENIYFRDKGISINSGLDGWMNQAADIGIEFNTPTVNFVSTNIYVTDTMQIGDVTNYTQFDDDGVQTMAGKARNYKTIKVFTAAELQRGSTPPSSGPGLTVIGNFSFEQYTINDDSILNLAILAERDEGTDITITIRWAVNEAYSINSAEVQWQVEWSAVPDDGSEALDNPTHFGTVTSGDINVPAIAKAVQETNITIPGTNILNTDGFGFTLKRVALVGGNDPAVEPGIVIVGVQTINDKLGDVLP